jgi:hypothetical protein
MPAKPVEHYWITGYVEYHTKPCSNTSKNNLLSKTQPLEQSNSCAHRNVHNRPQAEGRSLQLGFATNQEGVQQCEARSQGELGRTALHSKKSAPKPSAASEKPVAQRAAQPDARRSFGIYSLVILMNDGAALKNPARTLTSVLEISYIIFDARSRAMARREVRTDSYSRHSAVCNLLQLSSKL